MAMGGPPSARGGRRRAPMADINVTPLVDVMLVLLIIFMITAPLLVTGVPIKLPQNRAKALDPEDQKTVVTLDAKGAIYINDAPVDDVELSDRLESIAGDFPSTPQVFLRADAALDYGRVMEVIGELNHAGLNKVSLISNAAPDPVSRRSR